MNQDKVIYDIGMHKGEDSAFYLAKGFRVVGVEADPELVRECRRRFKKEIELGCLTIIEGAVVDQKSLHQGKGEVEFYRNLKVSVWGTLNEDWADRNARLGAESESIRVRALDLKAILERYGVPYYMKIDIEGADAYCLEALAGVEIKPDYLSIESEKVSFPALISEIRLLTSLGYKSFCAVQQANIEKAREPIPSREGHWANFSFPAGASGLFGKDLPGPWLSEVDLIRKYERIFTAYKLFGDGSLIRRLRPLEMAVRIAEKTLNLPMPGWFDTHARKDLPGR